MSWQVSGPVVGRILTLEAGKAIQRHFIVSIGPLGGSPRGSILTLRPSEKCLTDFSVRGEHVRHLGIVYRPYSVRD